MYVVKHEQTGATVGEHKTKKKALEQATEMQNAHEAIKAMHNGLAVSFGVEKVENLPVEEES